MILPSVATALHDALGSAISFDVPMARHTSLRVGGPADALATPTDRAGLAALLELCARHDLPVTAIGAGFNTLVTDGGIDGVVVSLKKMRGIERVPEHGLRAESGVSHHRITRHCVEHGLAGLEFGAGIPGTVGGWVAMNAGIGSREIVDVIRSIEIMPASGGPTQEIERDRLEFSYRRLSGLPAGSLIVAASFELTPSTPDAVQREVDRLLAMRSDSQPLDVPSCGSVFKNPQGDFAGRLIESAGLKGEQRGGAQISPLHANFIANTGGATSQDVQELIQRAQEAVERATGIHLCTEVRIVGRES